MGQRVHEMRLSLVLFTDECRATLDGPDGWAKGWILQDQAAPYRLRRQQGVGWVMLWAGIVGDTFWVGLKSLQESRWTLIFISNFCQTIFYHGTGHKVVLLSGNFYSCRIMLRFMYLTQKTVLSIKKHLWRQIYDLATSISRPELHRKSLGNS